MKDSNQEELKEAIKKREVAREQMSNIYVAFKNWELEFLASQEENKNKILELKSLLEEGNGDGSHLKDIASLVEDLNSEDNIGTLREKMTDKYIQSTKEEVALADSLADCTGMQHTLKNILIGQCGFKDTCSTTLMAYFMAPHESAIVTRCNSKTGLKEVTVTQLPTPSPPAFNNAIIALPQKFSSQLEFVLRFTKSGQFMGDLHILPPSSQREYGVALEQNFTKKVGGYCFSVPGKPCSKIVSQRLVQVNFKCYLIQFHLFHLTSLWF